MKKAVGILTTSFCIAYVSMSFVEFSFDPATWSTIQRGLCVLIAVMAMLAMSCGELLAEIVPSPGSPPPPPPPANRRASCSSP